MRLRWTGVREHRLAALLLAISLGVLLLAAVVPQQSSLPPLDYARWRHDRAPVSLWLEAAGLTRAGSAPWLPLSVAPLLLLLARCTTRRLAALLREWSLGRPAVACAQRLGWPGSAPGLSPPASERLLGPPGSAGSAVRVASTGAARRLGSIVFHLALLVGIAAVTLSWGTRFEGHVELAPGAAVADAAESYVATRSVWWTPAPSGLVLRLDAVHLATWPDGSLRDQTASVAVLRGGQLVRRAELGRSQPVDVEGLSILLGPQAGPAVLLAVGGQAGWVHLPTAPDDGQSSAQTTFRVPGTRLQLAARLEGATLDEPKEATLVLGVTGDPNRRWRLRPGETADLPGDVRLQLLDIDRWASLTVVRDPFAGWAVGAFGVGLLGLAAAVGLAPVWRPGWVRSVALQERRGARGSWRAHAGV